MKNIETMVNVWASSWNYYVTAFLFFVGLYIILASPNLIKKLIGLSIFQTAVIIFYVALAKIPHGTAPILRDMGNQDLQNKFDNPIPHVLMLTAIVVGVATTAVGLALMLRIYQAFGTIEADEIDELVNNDNLQPFVPYDEVEETKEDIKERLFKEYQEEQARKEQDIHHTDNLNDGFDGGFHAEPSEDSISEDSSEDSTSEDSSKDSSEDNENNNTSSSATDSPNNKGGK